MCTARRPDAKLAARSCLTAKRAQLWRSYTRRAGGLSSQVRHRTRIQDQRPTLTRLEQCRAELSNATTLYEKTVLQAAFGAVVRCGGHPRRATRASQASSLGTVVE